MWSLFEYSVLLLMRKIQTFLNEIMKNLDLRLN